MLPTLRANLIMDAVEAISKAEELLRTGRPSTSSTSMAQMVPPLPLSSHSNAIYKPNASGTEVRLIRLEDDTDGRSLDVWT